MKLIDLTQARQAAEALHQDPILKGAVLMVLNSLPAVEMPDYRTLVTTLVRSGDICELSANRKMLPLDACEDADCDCAICKANCSCARCENGSYFVWKECVE